MEMEKAAIAVVPVAGIHPLVLEPLLEALYPWTASTPCPEEMRLLLRVLGVLLGRVQEPLATLTVAVAELALLLVLVYVDLMAGWSKRPETAW